MVDTVRSRALTSKSVLSRGRIPRHVAIIMDGNGRWAARRGVPRLWGHKEGRKSVREIVETSIELGVEILTLYTFSKENWERPRREVGALMRFLVRTLKEEIQDLDDSGVRLKVIGQLRDLAPEVRQVIRQSVRQLQNNDKLLLQLAISYSGREEILNAMRGALEEIRERGLKNPRIEESLLRRHLYTADQPDPDLLIRTSGEMRISNFLLWQIAYTEIWVTETLWPDFRREDYLRAISDYQKRDRRFGRTD